MRSATGAHYIALDHMRALAVFLVVAWHCIHATSVPYSFVPAFFPLAIFDEGHTGVALFMTLSGYLFAKLLDGRAISFPAFLFNRALRLLPLLLLVMLWIGVERYLAGENMAIYALQLVKGFVYDSWPAGAWSVTVELHFYLILPILLWMFRRNRALPLLVIGMAIALRYAIHDHKGEVQNYAYSFIVGRIDQFVLGMLAFNFRQHLAKRHAICLLVVTAFLLFYYWFDSVGGFYQYPAHPSPSRIWIILPTIEGACYAMLIGWYDNSFSQAKPGRISQFIGRIGEYSYSIYLLHGFFLGYFLTLIRYCGLLPSNFYVVFGWSAVFLALMTIPGFLSFRYIELPFLKLRKIYTRSPSSGAKARAVGPSSRIA